MTDALSPLVRSLDKLLAKERQALLTGDLNTLTGLLQEKEALLMDLGPLQDAGEGRLAELRTKVERNQKLLTHALEGLRDVSERIKALRRAQRSLETYDQKGQRSVISTHPAQRMEKRA